MVDSVRLRLDLPMLHGGSALTGEGCVVGFVDSGFDLGHPTLASAVVSAWDQLAIDGGDEGPDGLGRVFSAEDDFGRMRDRDGHGTHIAGIAVGRATPIGIAPGASLVCVRYDGDEGDLLAGVDWVFSEADRLGLPAVVNLSQGAVHADGHDGMDPLSLGLDDLCGEGRILCTAAGNEGTQPIHAEAVVDDAGLVRVPLVVLPLEDLPAELQDRATARISGVVTADRLDDLVVVSARSSNSVSLGGTESSVAVVDDVLVQLVSQLDPMSGACTFAVELFPVNVAEDLPASAWWIEVAAPEGTGVHLWSRDMRGVFLDFTSDDGNGGFLSSRFTTDSVMIATPASCRSAITVGAVTGRERWTRQDGQVRVASDPLGSPCAFSNAGPTRDGREKPEVAAPGVDVLSCGSRQCAYPAVRRAQEGLIAISGTSQAAPVVTGIIALFLEADPLMTPDQVRQVLVAAAAETGSIVPTWDPRGGYGEVTSTSLAAAFGR